MTLLERAQEMLKLGKKKAKKKFIKANGLSQRAATAIKGRPAVVDAQVRAALGKSKKKKKLAKPAK